MSLLLLEAAFYYGRIKPGKFEYPNLNGRMLISKAVDRCQDDLACGGFTFKGSYLSKKEEMEVYFFHLVIFPDNQHLKTNLSLKNFLKNFNYLTMKYSYLQDNLENDDIKREAHYYHWSTYEVERDYIQISHLKVKSKLKYTKQINDEHK